MRDETSIVVPNSRELRTFFLKEAYDSLTAGHYGAEKTLEKLSRHWWWQGMGRDVQAYVRTCLLCQQMKHSTQKTAGWLMPITAPHTWHTVTLDLVGGFVPAKETSHNYCLVIVDKFSKYTLLKRVHETVTTEDIAKIFVKRVVAEYSVPSVIL